MGHLTELLKSVLEMGNIWGPLIGLNIGIEIWQILAIVVAVPIIFGLRRVGLWERLVPEFSLAIAAVGLFLVVTRI